MSATTTLIDWMRHGEPVGGARYRGRQDDPLSDKGWAQMRKAVGEYCPWQAVVSSPLSRCRAFAEEFSERHGLPLALDERLVEIGFGAWEGLTADEIEQSQPGALMRFYADPIAHSPPGAESLPDFRQRINAVWQDLWQSHEGRHVLLVSHAGVIRMGLALALDMPLDRWFCVRVDNAGITRIQCDRDGSAPPFYQLLFHGGAQGIADNQD